MLKQLLGTFLATSSLLSGVILGNNLPLHYRLFAKYLIDFSHAEVTQLPKHLHQHISDACWYAGETQATTYGSYYPEELTYSLGSFGCKKVGDQWEIWDTYKFDGFDSIENWDDRKEGGPIAIKLTNKLGNFNYKIKTKVAIYPKPINRKEYTRFDYSKIDLPF